VTKYADVEVSGQTDTAVQTNKISPIKHENKRKVLSCLIECLMAFKFYQTQERLSMTFTANGKNETFAVSLQLCVQ